MAHNYLFVMDRRRALSSGELTVILSVSESRMETPRFKSPAPASTAPARGRQPPLAYLTTDEALERLETTVAGRAAAEAQRRFEAIGPNELEAASRESPGDTLAAQFQNVLILILLAGTVVSGFLGHTLEAVVITVIVLFAVFLGFIQEYRAEPRARGAQEDGGARPRASCATARRSSFPRASWCPGTSSCCGRATACPPTRASSRPSILRSTRRRSPASRRP